MKIAVLTQYYKPEMGAPQNRLSEMCIGLKRLGAEVYIVTGMPNYPTGKIFPEYRGLFTKEEIVDDIEVNRYWLYASNSRKKNPRIFSMLSFSFSSFYSYFFLKRKNIDLIVVESPPLTLGLTGMFLSKMLNAGLVMNISDLWPLSAKELGAISANGIVYRLLEKLEKYLYRKSLFCMGQSQEIVDYIETHGANKTYLFRNGVDLERFQHEEKTFDDIAKPLKIVYAGLLGYAQGILNICLNINFKELGTEFHIYGSGGEQKEIEEYLGNSNDYGIFYHGKVSSDDIPIILEEADCTLIPLVKNIFGAVPSKIYESMAAGLPIFFSGEGEGRRIIEINNLGWVSSALDYDGLKSNISIVSLNRNILKEISVNCKYCAENKFNRPKQVKSLFDFIQKNVINK